MSEEENDDIFEPEGEIEPIVEQDGDVEGEEDDNLIPNYEDLVAEEPAREVNIDNAPNANRTLSEEEEETTHKTDLQSILKALTPRYEDKKLDKKLQPVHVSRVFPDNMLDSCKMTVLSRLVEYEPNETPDVWGIILATHTAHAIGFEGRGIIDRLAIAGVAHEEEIEKLSKELGF